MGSRPPGGSRPDPTPTQMGGPSGPPLGVTVSHGSRVVPTGTHPTLAQHLASDDLGHRDPPSAAIQQQPSFTPTTGASRRLDQNEVLTNPREVGPSQNPAAALQQQRSSRPVVTDGPRPGLWPSLPGDGAGSAPTTASQPTRIQKHGWYLTPGDMQQHVSHLGNGLHMGPYGVGLDTPAVQWTAGQSALSGGYGGTTGYTQSRGTTTPLNTIGAHTAHDMYYGNTASGPAPAGPNTASGPAPADPE